MAALEVFNQIGSIVDIDFIALEVLPVLWSFSLGPLLNLQQFTAFMTTIKTLSSRVEQEHRRKLQELSTGNLQATQKGDMMSFGGVLGPSRFTTSGDDSGNFEDLVLGRQGTNVAVTDLDGSWTAPAASRPTNTKVASAKAGTPTFSWSSNSAQQPSGSRAVTPDTILSSFAALTPTQHGLQSSDASSQAQRISSSPLNSMPLQRPGNLTSAQPSPMDWSSNSSRSNGWQGSSNLAFGQTRSPASGTHTHRAFSIAPPPSQRSNSTYAENRTQTQLQKQGLEKYESLI